MKIYELELHPPLAKQFREEYYYTDAKYKIAARSTDEARRLANIKASKSNDHTTKIYQDVWLDPDYTSCLIVS